MRVLIHQELGAYGLHYAADASPSDTAKGITGGVGMLAGGAIDTVSQRQHLAKEGHALSRSLDPVT